MDWIDSALGMMQ